MFALRPKLRRDALLLRNCARLLVRRWTMPRLPPREGVRRTDDRLPAAGLRTDGRRFTVDFRLADVFGTRRARTVAFELEPVRFFVVKDDLIREVFLTVNFDFARGTVLTAGLAAVFAPLTRFVGTFLALLSNPIRAPAAAPAAAPATGAFAEAPTSISRVSRRSFGFAFDHAREAFWASSYEL